MKILLLEDDIALNRAIGKILKLDGHTVDSFDNGAKVLELEAFTYDLYILDINVPQVNGLDLLNLIRSTNVQAKIIMISSNTDLDSIKKAYAYGCEDYLKKPFHIDELRLKIDHILKKEESLLDGITLKPHEKLTRMERRFLLLLLEHQGNLVPYSAIENHVYQDKAMNIDALRALVRRLREKLVNDLIENHPGEGYAIKSR